MEPVNIRVSGGETSAQTPPQSIPSTYENFIVSTNRDYQQQIKELQELLRITEKERDDEWSKQPNRPGGSRRK